MDSTFTLKIKKKINDQSKKYANDHNTSYSKLIENNLSAITKETFSEEVISPLVKSLSGVIEFPLSKDINHNEFYHKHITKKYL
jgi:hypothetical protein